MELKSLQRHIPALSIASALNERLTDLIANGRLIENDQIQRFHMYSEVARRKTFDSWPHMDYKWALPDQMAQAGFYHQSSESGDDRAMCFTCSVCLVCWEKTDEPWAEHERHSPECPFLKGEYTQNVPLTVTYATSPATNITGFDVMSSGDNGCIICIGNSVTGDINVWSVERELKKSTTFNINTCEKKILNIYQVEDGNKIKISALCTFKKQTVVKSKSESSGGTRIIAGIKCNFAKNLETKDKNEKYFLILYAVTEASQTNQSKPTINSNGSFNTDDSINPCLNTKNGSSLITIMESHEERFDDIKFIDNKEISNELGQFVVPKSQNAWTFIPQEKNESTDSSTILTNSPTTSLHNNLKQNKESKTSESELICFPLQCLEIPINDNCYEIDEIFTSNDNRYLLAVLRSKKNKEASDCDDVQLFVYEIDDKGIVKEFKLCEKKFSGGNVPIEFCILPKLDNNNNNQSLMGTESNAFVVTCFDGSIKVLSITSLNIMFEASIKGEKFISTVYCKNLERLCACTENGTLHFYSFYDLDSDSSDEIEDEASYTTDINDGKQVNYDHVMPSTSAAIPRESNDDHNQKCELIAYKKDICLHDLKLLYSLTLFDEILTPFSAEVPGCWTELIQAQKQRRHPQNFSPGEDSHLTRSWRLHNDATTWDEHLIELSLPKTFTSIGHINFKFSILQPCSNPPAIQVTLLKQKSIGLCCRRKSANKNNEIHMINDVDENINFNLNSTNSFLNSFENPVLSEEYLQARNAEILAGPIELSSCMDLNEQGGNVTFVSPKLLKSKARNYLLHIKTMVDASNDGHGKTRGEY